MGISCAPHTVGMRNVKYSIPANHIGLLTKIQTINGAIVQLHGKLDLMKVFMCGDRMLLYKLAGSKTPGSRLDF